MLLTKRQETEIVARHSFVEARIRARMYGALLTVTKRLLAFANTGILRRKFCEESVLAVHAFQTYQDIFRFLLLGSPLLLHCARFILPARLLPLATLTPVRIAIVRRVAVLRTRLTDQRLAAPCISDLMILPCFFNYLSDIATNSAESM